MRAHCREYRKNNKTTDTPIYNNNITQYTPCTTTYILSLYVKRQSATLNLVSHVSRSGWARTHTHTRRNAIVSPSRPRADMHVYTVQIIPREFRPVDLYIDAHVIIIHILFGLVSGSCATLSHGRPSRTVGFCLPTSPRKNITPAPIRIVCIMYNLSLFRREFPSPRIDSPIPAARPAEIGTHT